MRLEKKIHDKSPEEIREEIRIRRAGKVDLQLGKNGPTPGFIEEVRNRLRRQGVVKIRILKSYIRSSGMDRREIARTIARLVGAKLIEVRGYTFILAESKDKYRSI
jgi:RNA-binding protein